MESAVERQRLRLEIEELEQQKKIEINELQKLRAEVKQLEKKINGLNQQYNNLIEYARNSN